VRAGGAGTKVFAGVGFVVTLFAWGQMGAQASALDMQAEAVKPAHVVFSFERAGMPVPKFTLDVDQNGRGRYSGEEATPVVRGVATEPATQAFERRFAIAGGSAEKIFRLARQADRFNVGCASKAKNIADTGSKTLRYEGADGAGSCAFNYTENKAVGEITELMLGIAETMDEGRELDRLHRYDRLGLDDAMAALSAEVSAGRALGLETIAGTLRSLAGDAEVMQRVRTRAAALLRLIPADAMAPDEAVR
jgi:hypothetical protein